MTFKFSCRLMNLFSSPLENLQKHIEIKKFLVNGRGERALFYSPPDLRCLPVLKTCLGSSVYGAAGHVVCVEILTHVTTEAIETLTLEILKAFLALKEVCMLVFTVVSS
jgi:hypothetical protein